MSGKDTLVIGLTGGIGSGKSTVARMLAERGAKVVDADALAREVVSPGEPALEEIRAEFGDGVITERGELDRAALAEIVFRDPKARARLEAITHPRIAERIEARLRELRARGVEVVVYEAALLIEKRLHEGLDALIVVAAPPGVQTRRVMERDGVDEEQVRARMKAQLPLSEKTEQADWVVDNGGALEETEKRIDEVWRAIRNACSSRNGLPRLRR